MKKNMGWRSDLEVVKGHNWMEQHIFFIPWLWASFSPSKCLCRGGLVSFIISLQYRHWHHWHVASIYYKWLLSQHTWWANLQETMFCPSIFPSTMRFSTAFSAMASEASQTLGAQDLNVDRRSIYMCEYIYIYIYIYIHSMFIDVDVCVLYNIYIYIYIS